MGYTIYIVSEDKPMTEKMYNFLTEHIYEYDYSELAIGNDLSYVADKHRNSNVIGFNYGSISGMEREHTYSILQWISSKLSPGSKKYYYDGETSNFSKLLTEETDPNLRRERALTTFMMVDFFNLPKEIQDAEVNINIEFLRNDLSRLDQLWKKEL